MSMFKLLYQELMAHLGNTDNVADLKYLDQDMGQLDHYEKRPPIGFPGLLIDINNASFEDLGANVQLVTVSVTLRLAFTPYTPTNNLQLGAFSADALKFYDIENDIQKALHGRLLGTDDVFREIERTGASTEQRLDAIRVRSLVYSIQFEDDSTKEVPLTHNAKLYFKNIPPSAS